MYTIALIAQKGGTGKTTITVSLATAAAQAGLTALIIDLDPQATACNWSDRRKKSYPESENPTVIDAQPARLQAVLEKVEGKVDIIFIDTPARSEQSSLAAAKVADLVLIPCRPQAYDLETIPNTREILSLAGDKPALAILNAVPSYGDRHEQAKIFRARIIIPVCPITFGHRAAFGDAGAVGKTAAEYDPKGKGADEILQTYKYIIRLLGSLRTKEKHEHESQSKRVAS